jgi:hypothetical protein
MTGCVVSVHFLILIGETIAKSVMNLALPVVLCRDLRTGSVPSVAISITLVDKNVTAAKDPKAVAIDFVLFTRNPYFLSYSFLIFLII